MADVHRVCRVVCASGISSTTVSEIPTVNHCEQRQSKQVKLPLTLTHTGFARSLLDGITVYNSKRPQCSKARHCGRSIELLTRNANPILSFVCRHPNRDMPGEGDGLIFPPRLTEAAPGVICAIFRQNQVLIRFRTLFPAMLLIITHFRDLRVTYLGCLSMDLGRQLIRKGEAPSVVF